LGALPTALAYTLFARGLKRIGAGETATLTLAEPVTAAALGFLVLGERPGAAALVGAALVLAGLMLLALRPSDARRVRVGAAEVTA
jgi:drug/metabolite transporter, DME family